MTDRRPLRRRAMLTALGTLTLPRLVHADPALEEAARKEGAVTWYIAQVDAEKDTEHYPVTRNFLIRTKQRASAETLV